MSGISIGIDPNMISVGGFVITWHGFFTFVAVALSVFLVGYWARKDKEKAEREGEKRETISADTVYSVAVWAIIGGIVGARVVHVIDFSDFYSNNPAEIVKLWNGGIAIYGAVLGGFVGGAAYCLATKVPVGKLADLTAPALLISMALGRMGDVINGEHIARTTTLPWGFVYTNPASPSNILYGLGRSHPAVVYEMIWDLAVLAVVWSLRNRLRPYGMVFALFLALYSGGRFFISFLREDKAWLVGLDEAQLISLIVVAAMVSLLIYKAQVVKPVTAPRPAAKRPA